MTQPKNSFPNIKTMALVAHDQKKDALVEWVQAHKSMLSTLTLYGTGTTGGRIANETGLNIECLKSGPLGGDAQIGAMIAENKLDALIFFTDPLSALPHDVDVKSLLRLATLYNTVLAINEASASLIVSSLE
ncbi:methylglyoxal synthase [Amylibacter marinus]|uniref:Methylglyoxal synthase n=1 Tax=Amylibacter marinus TaxID=1475483 RepID=A0ABQ5VWB0_9RHOB|nr:methylglyoxal synthase [Amylibacter marinus]GLQ35351.1 methylglyoxal synthase [Amylibacter marinus]